MVSRKPSSNCPFVKGPLRSSAFEGAKETFASVYSENTLARNFTICVIIWPERRCCAIVVNVSMPH